MASFICAAAVAGNSDHSSAMAPVTKGTATLVPPSVIAWPCEPRLVMLSPGALNPPPANRSAKIRLVHRPASKVTGHDRDDPRVAGDGGTSKRALIARRRNDEYAASESLIERLLQRLLAPGRRLCQGEAQVDYPCACINALDDRRRKIQRRRAGHVFAPSSCLAKNGANQQRATGANRRGGGIALCGQYSGDKSSVQAGRAIGLCAGGSAVSWDFLETLRHQIGVSGSHRSIDQPDFQSGAAVGAFHQRCKLD